MSSCFSSMRRRGRKGKKRPPSNQWLQLGLDRQTFVNLLSSKKKKVKKLRGSAKDEFLEQKFFERRPEPTPKQTECDIFSTIGTDAECEVKRQKDLQLKEQVKIHNKRLTILETNRKQIYRRRTEKGNARTTIKYLEHLLQDQESYIIQTLDTTKHRTFSPDTSLCVMNLLNEGVGVNHVASVMENVAELCGKTFSQVPSAIQMSIE